VASASYVLGGIAIASDRVARAVKGWIDVLIAGVDLQQRKQALDRSRNLAPYELQEAQLRNALLQQQLQNVTAPPESGLVDEARAEVLRDPSSKPKPRGWRDSAPGRIHRVDNRRPAGSMSSLEFAELLDEPVDRLLGYAGGELEVAGNQGTLL
jgi:hypothetical protein